MQAFYVPRTAREVQQKNGWILLRPFRNATVLCSTRSPRGPAESRVHFNQTLQKCKLFMFHAGPQKSFRNKGALCCTSIFGSQNLKMHAEITRPFRNAKSKNPPKCMDTPPRRLVTPWTLVTPWMLVTPWTLKAPSKEWEIGITG